MEWVGIPLRRDVLDTTLCDKVCQFCPVSSTNKTDRNDITDILFKHHQLYKHKIEYSTTELQP